MFWPNTPVGLPWSTDQPTPPREGVKYHPPQESRRSLRIEKLLMRMEREGGGVAGSEVLFQRDQHLEKYQWLGKLEQFSSKNNYGKYDLIWSPFITPTS